MVSVELHEPYNTPGYFILNKKIFKSSFFCCSVSRKNSLNERFLDTEALEIKSNSFSYRRPKMRGRNPCPSQCLAAGEVSSIGGGHSRSDQQGVQKQGER